VDHDDIVGFFALLWLGRRQARKAAEAAESVSGFRRAALDDEMSKDQPGPVVRNRGLEEDLA
jgi:hypothetical protein